MTSTPSYVAAMDDIMKRVAIESGYMNGYGSVMATRVHVQRLLHAWIHGEKRRRETKQYRKAKLEFDESC